MDFQYNTFVNGVVTDVTETNAPENSLKESVNMDISFDGSIFRRNSLEEALSINYSNIVESTITKIYYKVWNAYEGQSYRVIVTYYNTNDAQIRFVDYSGNGYSKEITTTYNRTIALDFGKNSCFVTTGTDTFYIEASSDGTISDPSTINIKIRDFSGVPDNLNVTERPATLSDNHLYNLVNQGWGVSIKEYSSGTSKIDYVHVFDSKSAYPSDADNPTVALQENPNAGDEKRFRVSNLDSAYLGSSRAPKGSMLIYINNMIADGDSPLDTDRNAGSSDFILNTFTTQLQKATPNRPTTLAFNSGRVFYSGVYGSKAYTSTVFFSKTLTSNSLAGDCYQDADPTSGDISELVDTDGGAINIPEASDIFRLISYRDTLLVFAANGVWGISGTSSSGFIATSYRVYKIADISPISGSVSLTEFGVVFATKEGLFTLSPDNITGDLNATNLLIGKVQSYYNNITDLQKDTIQLTYDAANKRLYCLYEDIYGVLNNVLVFNAPLQAYYTYKLSTTKVAGISVSPNSFFIDSTENVVDSSGNDVTVGGEVVTMPIKIAQNIPTKVELLIRDTSSMKVATFTGTDYNDLGEGLFESYFIINSNILKDLSRRKQVFELFCQFKKTETGFIEDLNGDMVLENQSSCLVTPSWDYAESSSTGKVSKQFQAYRHKRLFIPDATLEFKNFSSISTSTKLRGSGKSIQLRIDAEDGKHLNMIGYSMRAKHNIGTLLSTAQKGRL